MLLFQIRIRELLSVVVLRFVGQVIGRDVATWRELVPTWLQVVGFPLQVIRWTAPVWIVFAFALAWSALRGVL